MDGNGDVFYHGTLHTFADAREGGHVTAYGPKATVPAIEDFGSAQLVNGQALVKLDPAFAQAIDLHAPYHVFLTPNGDSRGLFVASKSPAGFVVREVQGGRGTLLFDYRIVATALGHAGERMVFEQVTPGPKGAIVAPPRKSLARSFSDASSLATPRVTSLGRLRLART